MASLSLLDHLLITILLILARDIISAGVVIAPPPTLIPLPQLHAPSPTPCPPRLGPPTRTPLLPPPRTRTPPLTPLPCPWLGAPPPARVPPRLGAPSRTPILPSPRVGAPPSIPPVRPPQLGAPLPTHVPPTPQLGAPSRGPVLPPSQKSVPPSTPPLLAPRLGAPHPSQLPPSHAPIIPRRRKGTPPSTPPLPTPQLRAPLPSSLLPPARAPIPPRPRKHAPRPAPRVRRPIPSPIIPTPHKGTPPSIPPIPATHLGIPLPTPVAPPRSGAPSSSTPLPTPRLGAPLPSPLLPPARAPILPPRQKRTPPPAPHFKAPVLPPRRKGTPPPAPHFKPPILPPRRKGTPLPAPHFKPPVLPPRRKGTPPPAPRVKAPIPSPIIPPPRKGTPPFTPISPPRLGVPLPSPLPQPPHTPILPPPQKRVPPSSPPPRLGAPLPSPLFPPPRTPVLPPPRLGAPPRSPILPPPQAVLPSPPRYGAPLPTPLVPPPQYAAAPPPSPPTGGGPKVPALIAFGDSIVDTGNNNYLTTVVKANFPPYGREYPGHKATGRFSDGKITVDFLASALGLKETLPPYLNKSLTLEDLKTGVTFASAGSGYNNATCRTSSTMTIERQLQLFAEYKAKVGTIPERALFVVCSGSNDIVEHFTFADSMTSPEYAEMMARRAIGLVEALIGQGARQIALTGSPPVGCVPSQRRMAGGVRTQCATDRNQLALLFNRKLSLEVAKLSGRYRGVNIFYVDLYSIVADVVQRYQALGFKDGKDACCGYVGLAVGPLCNIGSRTCPDPSKYVFWDSYHPTERAYKIMMDDFLTRYTRYIH